MTVVPRSTIVERIAAAPLDAHLHEQDGRWTLTVRRVFAHPPTRVWPLLTDPQQLARWSPVVPDRVLDSPGPATSRESPDADPVDATVLVSRAPHELVHRWGEATLRWSLREVPDGTQVTLEHAFDDRPQAPSYAAGWHLCLVGLMAVADGDTPPSLVGRRALDYGWQDLNDTYTARFGE